MSLFIMPCKTGVCFFTYVLLVHLIVQHKSYTCNIDKRKRGTARVPPKSVLLRFFFLGNVG